MDETVDGRHAWRVFVVRAWREADGLRAVVLETGPASGGRRRVVARSAEGVGRELVRALRDLEDTGHAEAGDDALTQPATAPHDAAGPTERGPR